MKVVVWSLVGVVATGACTVGEVKRERAPEERITKAITAPLDDLNLVREKIPEVLLQAKVDPYRVPESLACAALAEEILALDRVLGPDLDVRTSDEAGWKDRGMNELGEAAWGALEGAATGLIPYRGWVRKLTGAERRSKEVAAAIAAGIARRSYLKGIGQGLGCEAPAAPRPMQGTEVRAFQSSLMSAITGA